MKTKTTASGAAEVVPTLSRETAIEHPLFGLGNIIGEKFFYPERGWIAQVEFASGMSGAFNTEFLKPLPV